MNPVAARQQPPAGSLFLDHVGHFVADLEAAARALEALGFAPTPFSPQATPEGPAGTANRCVMLEEGYLELLAPVADTAHARRVREAMAGHAGVHVFAFGTPAAQEEHARLARHGFEPPPLVRLEREVELDGATHSARFVVARVPPERMPEGRVQFVQQLTPECLWQRRYLAHDNGVSALAAVFVVAGDPVAAAARYARFAGLLPRPAGALVRLATARGAVLIGRAADWERLLGAAPPAPALAGYALACRDPRALAQRCASAGLAVRAAGDGLHAVQLPPQLGGAWLLGEAAALASFEARGLPVQ
ncbi:MAG TPA: VOC family protein [Burkholderiales bacterium]|nr:VOC family protein [Burkholderiales bacterium]